METAAQTCARLLTALEDLTAQEAASLEARDFPAVIALQDRAAPLIDLLSAHAQALTERGLRDRVQALMVRRNQTGEWLAEQIERARAELQQTQVAQRRVARVAPAYTQPPIAGGRRQLCVVG